MTPSPSQKKKELPVMCFLWDEQSEWSVVVQIPLLRPDVSLSDQLMRSLIQSSIRLQKQHAINNMFDIIHGNEQMTLHYEPHVLWSHYSIQRFTL